MPTHAILITYRDMVTEVKELILKAKDKYRAVLNSSILMTGMS